MKKPEHQWETRMHRAVRRGPHPGESWSDDPRAEEFRLEFFQHAPGRAVCGLQLQVVDRWAWDTDPDLEHALSCWVVARGGRQLRIEDEHGRRVHEASISPARLGEPGTRADRIVTLCPSNAEMVHALGCFDRVIACEDSSDFPPEVAGIERLGPDLGVDVERVAALGPDLAVSSLTVPGMERNVTALRARGVAQVVLAPLGIGDVLEELTRLGQILGAQARAQRVRIEMETEIARLKAERPATALPVYLEWWPRPMFSPGGRCYSNELIELAGGRNVFRNRQCSSQEVSAEELVAANPAIAFVSWCGVAADKLDPRRVLDRPGISGVEAVRRGRVFPLDETFAGRPGPRMLEAARIMAKHIKDCVDDRA